MLSHAEIERYHEDGLVIPEDRLPEETVAEMAAAGEARPVTGAPRIGQPVFALVHLRQRHRSAYRRMIRALRGQVPQGSGE